ncbi:TOBE domain-containing protein [Lachnospiraceae bacterium 54-53]
MNFLSQADGTAIAVRPEDVVITRGEVLGQIQGSVRTIMVLGHFVEVNVEVGDQVIKTYVTRSVADNIQLRDKVSLSFTKTCEYCA